MTRTRKAGTRMLALAVTIVALAAMAHADESSAAIKARLLGWINQARAADGLAPVAFDLHASDAADEYCRRQIDQKTTGHFDRGGMPPYARYSAAGIIDGISENAASWSADYPFDATEVAELVRKSHDSMLAESPPDDGHRAALLDPAATHVGLGLQWRGGELRLVEVFIRRYLKWSHPFPSAAAPADRPWATAAPRPGFRIDQISVYWEAYPRPLTTAEANRIESYGLPKRYRDYRPRPLPRSPAVRTISGDPPDSARGIGSFTVQRDGAFDFVVPFDDGPGIYTVVVWVKRDGSDVPIAASNAAIRVGSPLGVRDTVAGGR